MDRDRVLWASVVVITFAVVAIAAAAIVGANTAAISDDASADAFECPSAQYGDSQLIDTMQRCASCKIAGTPVASEVTNGSNGNDSISKCLNLINDLFREISKQNYVEVMEDVEKIYELAEEADYGQLYRLMVLAEETLDMDRFDRIAAQLPIIIKCFEEGDYAGAVEAHASIVADISLLASEFKELSEKWNSSQEYWNLKAFGPVKAAHPDEHTVPVMCGSAI